MFYFFGPKDPLNFKTVERGVDTSNSAFLELVIGFVLDEPL